MEFLFVNPKLKLQEASNFNIYENIVSYLLDLIVL